MPVDRFRSQPLGIAKEVLEIDDMTWRPGMSAKKEAVKTEAVKIALQQLLGNWREIQISQNFLQRWEAKARALGASLSAERIASAICQLKVRIIVLKDGWEWLSRHNLRVSFGGHLSCVASR